MSHNAGGTELEDGEDPIGAYPCPADDCIKRFDYTEKRYKHIKNKHPEELRGTQKSAW